MLNHAFESCTTGLQRVLQARKKHNRRISSPIYSSILPLPSSNSRHAGRPRSGASRSEESTSILSTRPHHGLKGSRIPHIRGSRPLSGHLTSPRPGNQDSKAEEASPPLENAFSQFCKDIFTVAQAHFHSHICGSGPPPAPYPKALSGNTSTTLPNRLGSAPDPPPSKAPPRAEPTYASAAKTAATPSITPRKSLKPPPRQETQRDSRLFVRLHPSHPFRQLSSYAILDVLKNAGFPKEIREVQIVNSGLALCPATPTTRTVLVTRIQEIQNLFSSAGDCLVEEAHNLKSYKLTSVPRAYTGLDGTTVSNIPVTAEALSQALLASLGFSPVFVGQTRGSQEADQTYPTSWIVRVDSSSSIPRSLILFGCRATSRYLPKKVKVVQCSRCFLWHNERSCARPLRCRLCGSIEHSEASHPACLPHPHPCPPRCIHCHGPHPADAPECPLRPKPGSTPPPKAEVARLRQAGSAARLQLKAAHCKPLTPTPHPTDPTYVPESPSHPPSGQPPVHTDVTMHQEEVPTAPSATTPTSPAPSTPQALRAFQAASSPVPSQTSTTPPIRRSHSTLLTTTAPYPPRKKSSLTTQRGVSYNNSAIDLEVLDPNTTTPLSYPQQSSEEAAGPGRQLFEEAPNAW